jgi:hypothetical protein
VISSNNPWKEELLLLFRVCEKFSVNKISKDNRRVK